MSIDGQLLERVRRVLGERGDVVEKRMVGGRSFSTGGRMFCGVTSRGLMVRVGRDAMSSALSQAHVTQMSMGSRPVAAFVIVAPAGVAGDLALAKWVQRGLDVVRDEGTSANAAPRRGRQHLQRPTQSEAPAPVVLSSGTERFASLVEQFRDVDGVTSPDVSGRRGFGSSALKGNGSIFAMLTRNHLVVKLPPARVAELIAARTGEPFTAGKTTPMKEWLVVTAQEPGMWLEVAREALAFGRGRSPLT